MTHATKEYVVEIHASWRTGDAYMPPLAPPAQGTVTRCGLARIVTVGQRLVSEGQVVTPVEAGSGTPQS